MLHCSKSRGIKECDSVKDCTGVVIFLEMLEPLLYPPTCDTAMQGSPLDGTVPQDN